MEIATNNQHSALLYTCLDLVQPEVFSDSVGVGKAIAHELNIPSVPFQRAGPFSKFVEDPNSSLLIIEHVDLKVGYVQMHSYVKGHRVGIERAFLSNQFYGVLLDGTLQALSQMRCVLSFM